MDFDIPLPHILLPLALSFVTFQQIAFLYDCYKRTKGQLSENLNMDFIDYALFISFFPQLIAGPIVHHREMMPQFARLGGDSSCHINSYHTDKSCHTKHSLCHTERSEVSKSPNCHIERSEISTQNTEFMDFSPTAQNDKMRHFTQNDKNSAKSQINYEFLAKGIFIFSIGLFKKAFIADSFAKWANAGFSKVENGVILNMAESWATSLSYTFQLYFDFSGYCDMAIGLGLMFGIVLPLNFNSPYKSLNIAEFLRRCHITLGRFLTECVYVPLGGNRVSKILNLRNIFIVFFLSGVWHGAGWGFVIWGILHALAMMAHRVYRWFIEWLKSQQNYRLISSLRADEIGVAIHKNKIIDCHAKARNDSTYTMRFLKFTQTRLYKVLCWLLTFNFVSVAWVFFRAENLQGALNLFKGMFGVVWVELPQKWHRMPETLAQIDGRNDTIFYILISILVCVFCKNSFEFMQNFHSKAFEFSIVVRVFSKKIWLKGGGVFVKFIISVVLFYTSVWLLFLALTEQNAYSPFIYFNF